MKVIICSFKKSTKSLSVSEGNSGEVAGGGSCIDTVYTLFASNPDIEALPEDEKARKMGVRRVQILVAGRVASIS